MRKFMTVAEKIVWINIRKRAVMGYKFRRQVRIGNFIIDFLCVELKLVIEIDGFTHDYQKQYDKRRTKWLEKDGHYVIRFTNEEVLSASNMLYKKIEETCLKLKPPP